GARASSAGTKPSAVLRPLSFVLAKDQGPMTKDIKEFFLRHPCLWLVLATTLLGGAMRFSFLSKPPLWGDEGLTYSRVCGDFREMLDVLQFDGFPPLHYEAYWLLGRIAPLTPIRMRWIPAVAGTLMIPTMYFLAVQVLRRRSTALLVALFTCMSAYMMAFSRD